MDARRRDVLLLALAVPASSLLGLLRPMLEEGNLRVFGQVWAANAWGDLVFTAGTIAASWVVARWIARTPEDRRGDRLAFAAIGAFVLHWAVYAVAWTLTGWAYSGHGFWGVHLGGFPDAWMFTLQWGWPGLAAMAIAGPGVTWAVLRHGKTGGTMTPVAA
jgi:hypothetical protein